MKRAVVLSLSLAVLFLSCNPASRTVSNVIDNLVTRLYADMNDEQLASLSHDQILSLLSDRDKNILATQYWRFKTNVPVIVSLMRHVDQAVIPFWLESSGFKKTELVVTNDEYTYEVWQKAFNNGFVELGINGFDKHRPHYFISVGPQDPSDTLRLSDFYPKNQHVSKMSIDAFTYHDWDELVLTSIPDELVGQTMLTTIRGRAREAHLVSAFRNTPFPSSEQPDQILLTWADTPQSSQSIQWRTNTLIKDGVVEYWTDSTDTRHVNAERAVMQDRLLKNDRFIHRFTAKLADLTPSTRYSYRVGSPSTGIWSKVSEFITAPSETSPFSFISFGDTHRSPHWGQLINTAFDRHPDAAFYTIAGDMVSTGLYRDDWDKLFEYSKDVIRTRPLMPALGNHDDQDGLGAWMFFDLFDLPKNGPENLEAERAFYFEYSNTLFLILDATHPIEPQAQWMEKVLATTKAIWKFVVFHFPPYSYEEDYTDIRTTWGALFDKYHVDIVLSGHVHYYMRSKPMYAQQPVHSPKNGTIYIISIAVPNRDREMPFREWVDVRFGGNMLYQKFDINNTRLLYRAYNLQGDIRDELIIQQ